jgi:membrane protein insertase Oxa1/YidC/SpoIIIJ
MAGCVPGLLQMPVFYALFQFSLQQVKAGRVSLGK